MNAFTIIDAFTPGALTVDEIARTMAYPEAEKAPAARGMRAIGTMSRRRSRPWVASGRNAVALHLALALLQDVKAETWPLSWDVSLWRAEARTCGSATRIRSRLPHHAVQRLVSSPQCAATVRAALDIPHLTNFLPETTLYRRPVSTDQTCWRER